MGSDSGSRRIRAAGAAPDQGEVTASRSQIEQWLRDTLPTTVDDAGFAYMHAASTIGALRDALPSNAAKLSQLWRGEASAEVQKALRMLHSTAEELVSTMEKMAEVLRLYGGVYLPEAREKIENLKDPKGLPLPSQESSPGSPLLSGRSPSSGTFDADGTIAARQVLRTLNTQIVDLYHRVPESISYNLPTVTMPSGDHTYAGVVYRQGDPYQNGRPPSGDGSQGAGTGSGGTDGSATGGAGRGGSGSTSGPGASGPGASGPGASGPGASGPGASGPGASGPGASGPDGSGPGGSGPSGSNPGGPGTDGSDPGGSDPGGSGNDGSGSDGSAGTNGQDPSTAADAANEAGIAQNSPDDGTVPAVIDGTDGTPGDDPGSTEVASFVPQNPVAVPVIQQSPVGLIGPTTTVAPPVTSVPPVLGTLGTGSGTAVPSYAAMARGTVNGMPMMPFMGGGAGGESAQESERFSPLTEENDVWGSHPDATSALIGESATDFGKVRHGDRA